MKTGLKNQIIYKRNTTDWKYRLAQCSGCHKVVIELRADFAELDPSGGFEPYQWSQVYPIGGSADGPPGSRISEECSN